MEQIINGKRYDTKKAHLVASSIWTLGRASSLYKTAKGNFFSFQETCWDKERDSIQPLTVGEAKALYESLPNSQMSWEEAFGESPEEA